MIRKVYTSTEEFFKQNKELDTGLPFSDDISLLKRRRRCDIIYVTTMPNEARE